VVARWNEWLPEKGEEVTGCRIRGGKPIESNVFPMAQLVLDPQVDEGKILAREVHIHGQCCLPPGYHLVCISGDILVKPNHDIPVHISSSQNIAKSIASVVQLLFACATLYRARGDQLSHYGYAAFSLTVIPYAIMSLVNLLGNIMSPNYPSMYIIESEVLREAKTRGGKFDGTVGFLVEDTNSNEEGQQVGGNDTIWFEGSEGGQALYKDQAIFIYDGLGLPEISVPKIGRHVKRNLLLSERTMILVAYGLLAVATVAPYIIIAWLTKFEPRNSSSSQRGWTMSWLVVGQIAGVAMAKMMTKDHWRARLCILLFPGVILLIPAVGGFIAVAKMFERIWCLCGSGKLVYKVKNK
jgi:hypothetical protein